MAMIRMHDWSPQFEPHSNYYTMPPVQNDQDPTEYEPMGAQLPNGPFKP